MVVRKQGSREKLLTAFPKNNPGSRTIATAPVVIVVCADPTTSWVENGIEYYIADTVIAFEPLCLAAHALGLSTCWMGWFKEAAIRAALGIPESIRVIGITPLWAIRTGTKGQATQISRGKHLLRPLGVSMTLKEEYAGRITGLQSKLRVQGLDGALISHPIDLYYFTGTRQNGIFWASASGDAQLLVRKSLGRAREEAQVDQVRPFPSSKEFASTLSGDSARIGMTFDVLPVQQYNYYAKLLPDCQFSDISTLVRDQRAVKSDWELDVMRHGAEQLCSVFAQVPDFLRAGMREVDLSAEFEMRLRKAGGEGYTRMRAYNQELFMGLAVSGDRGSTPGFFDGAVTGFGMSKASPHGASAHQIARHEPIMIDYTGTFNGYILDMTRIFVIGDLTDELYQAFDSARVIQEQVAAAMRPGAICAEIFDLAVQMAESANFDRYFMGPPGEQAKFVGHGVGLELDEIPVLAKGYEVPLQLNQTIAVEPKFVFPGIGVVGIENTFVVGKDGATRLTCFKDDLVKL